MVDEIGPTPKNVFWENIVLPAIPSLTPGTYLSPVITVAENGLVTSAANGVIHLPTVANAASLPTIASPAAGTVAVVLDDGMGNIVLFSYNIVPTPGWYQITFPPALGASSVSFSHSTAFPLALANVQPISVWKRFVVTIKTAFSAGTAMSIVDSNSVVWMTSTLINPLIPGTYELEVPGNDVPAGLGTRLNLVCTGSPTTGSAVAYIEYVIST